MSRILFIKNLPFKLSDEEYYECFGKFGTIRQIRKGNKPGTNGCAFVMYDELVNAKKALGAMTGFKIGGRYLKVSFYHPARYNQKQEDRRDMKLMDDLRSKYLESTSNT